MEALGLGDSDIFNVQLVRYCLDNRENSPTYCTFKESYKERTFLNNEAF